MAADIDVSTTENGVDIVRLSGRLNMASAPELATVVGDRVRSGHNRIVVDMSGVDFMDSSGLGALVSCLKKAREAGGDLRLAAPTAQVSTVLDLTNLSTIMRPADSLDAALEGF